MLPEPLSYQDVIARYLNWRARAFVRRVDAEWDHYTKCAYAQAKPGCMRRAEVAKKLRTKAYNAWAATFEPNYGRN